MKRGTRHGRSKRHSRVRRTRGGHMRGGYGPGAKPVGYGWKADPVWWPGVAAANGANTEGATMSNFLPLSPNGIAVGGVKIAEPEIGFFGGRRSRRARRVHKRKTMRKQKKGSRRRTTGRRARRMRGGFGPQDLLNFGRDLKFKAQGLYSDFMGNQQPVNPSPLVQPISKDYKVIEPTPINLPRSYNLSGASVAPL